MKRDGGGGGVHVIITTRAPPVAALATLATVCVGAVAASCAGGGQFQFEQPTVDDALRAAACGVTYGVTDTPSSRAVSQS